MPASSAVDSIPTPADVDRIAALPDPVIRNLQITQCYHELAVALAARAGLSANWCTFATWASKQAGQTIRKEDLARTLETLLSTRSFSAQAAPEVTASAQALGSDRSPAEVQESVAAVLNPLAAINRASDAVARGNRKVFEEIGREFARFLATCASDEVFEPETIDRYCASLRLGEPPDGQRWLQRAFARYYQAFFESDAKTRAELLLCANIEIGLHEQTRLQPEIMEAMDAAFVDYRQFRLRLIKALFPYNGWLARIRLFLLNLFNRPSPFEGVVNMLLAEARRRARHVITECMMTLELPPNIHLRLGETVPGEFPASLTTLSLSDLCTLLEQIDPTPDSTVESGAVDWADLRDRLHFIIDLFRCTQELPALFDPPFSDAQVAALKAGHVPEGRL